MEAVFIMSAVLLLAGAVSFFLAWWSRDPRHLGTAVGRLENSKKVMRYPYRRSTRKVPFTTAVYLYEVGGRTYRVKRDGRFGRSTLLSRVTVVYLRGFPRFGHLDRYPVGGWVLLGTFMTVYGCILLLPNL